MTCSCSHVMLYGYEVRARCELALGRATAARDRSIDRLIDAHREGPIRRWWRRARGLPPLTSAEILDEIEGGGLGAVVDLINASSVGADVIDAALRLRLAADAVGLDGVVAVSTHDLAWLEVIP